MRGTRYAIAAAGLAALLAAPAYAQMGQSQTMPDRGSRATQTQNKAGSEEAKFMTKAIEGDLAEVQMGQLAQQKGQSAEVKQLGQMLVNDHGKHLEQAKSLAQSLGVTPPSAPNSSQKKDYDKLSQLSGDKFDREFVQHMVKDHKKDISEYKKEAKSKNAQIAGFASQTVPDLEKHLQMAQSAEKNIKAANRGTTRDRQNAQVPPRAQ